MLLYNVNNITSSPSLKHVRQLIVTQHQNPTPHQPVGQVNIVRHHHKPQTLPPPQLALDHPLHAPLPLQFARNFQTVFSQSGRERREAQGSLVRTSEVQLVEEAAVRLLPAGFAFDHNVVGDNVGFSAVVVVVVAGENVYHSFQRYHVSRCRFVECATGAVVAILDNTMCSGASVEQDIVRGVPILRNFNPYRTPLFLFPNPR
mmetsp:Transcript_7703/g.16682  ORF Transcript_7703/g.16682 Transcript_7703/m.16682 type:complete len:203 (-) Transcript_7703:435-1043(-)